MKARHGFGVILLFLFPFSLGADPTTTPVATLPAVVKESEFHWQESSETDGLTLYQSKVEGSEVIALKGEGIVNAPLEKVASVIVDYTRGTEWIDGLVASKLVRPLGPTEFVEYDHMGIPFPFSMFISDRDFISHVTVDYSPATQRLTVSYLPTEDGLAPVLKQYKRGVMTCVFKMVPMSMADQTYLEAEIHCDPKGGVPKWLVNFFQQDWPHTTFENLRREMKKPDIQVHPIVAQLLKKPTEKTSPKSRQPKSGQSAPSPGHRK
jgi:hypothetical protein